MEKIEFLKVFCKVAKQVEQETGIFADAMLTQAALETGWGVYVKNNNYFGIKAGEHFQKKQLIRTKEYHSTNNVHYKHIISVTPVTIKGKPMFEYVIEDFFYFYDNPIDSFRAYCEFIKTNKRYQKALCQSNASAYLREVAAAGYATDPEYNSKLQAILKSIQCKSG